MSEYCKESGLYDGENKKVIGKCKDESPDEVCVCVSLFYVIDTGSIRPRARTELEVTYLPFAFSSDASCADLSLPLQGAPVDIGALVKLGSRSLAEQDRDWSSRPPGTGPHVPFRRGCGLCR